MTRGGSFVDLGCGSGVLAILAGLLGFAPLAAVDVQPASVDATRVNAAQAGVDVRVAEADLSGEPGPASGVVRGQCATCGPAGIATGWRDVAEPRVGLLLRLRAGGRRLRRRGVRGLRLHRGPPPPTAGMGRSPRCPGAGDRHSRHLRRRRSARRRCGRNAAVVRTGARGHSRSLIPVRAWRSSSTTPPVGLSGSRWRKPSATSPSHPPAAPFYRCASRACRGSDPSPGTLDHAIGGGHGHRQRRVVR